MGTQDGSIFLFDPIIRGKMEIKKFTYDQERKKTVDLIRWLAPSPVAKFTARFLVVFSDGSIAFYHKDKTVNEKSLADLEKDYIKIPSANNKNDHHHS